MLHGMSRAHMTEGDRQYRLRTGRLCLELVATLRSRMSEIPQDDIAETTRLVDWLATLGVHTSKPPAQSDIAKFQALREAIYRLATAVTGAAHQDAPRAADIALINEHARHGAPVAQLCTTSSPQGRATLTTKVARPTVAQVLTMLARDAVDLLTGPEIGRLRQCQASSCGSFYLDTSRGGQRRWCSSASCGNRVRVAAHRDRHRT